MLLHSRNLWRDTLRDRNMQTDGSGCIFYRFSYDTVNEQPDRIRQLLALLIGRWTGIGEKGAGAGR